MPQRISQRGRTNRKPLVEEPCHANKEREIERAKTTKSREERDGNGPGQKSKLMNDVSDPIKSTKHEGNGREVSSANGPKKSGGLADDSVDEWREEKNGGNEVPTGKREENRDTRKDRKGAMLPRLCPNSRYIGQRVFQFPFALRVPRQP